MTGALLPHIRRICADEGPKLRALRLHALAEVPMAFGSTLAVEQGFSDAVWRERAIGASAGCDRATFIAERDRQWLGLVTGLARQDDLEKAGPLLVSMFVDSTARRVGIGVRLVEAVSAWARACGAARLSLWVTPGMSLPSRSTNDAGSGRRVPPGRSLTHPRLPSAR
jgi:GNAT superfamily N-acetyltransferase